MQKNKNGIPIWTPPKARTNKREIVRNKRKEEVHKLDYRVFAVFVGCECGVEVTITVPNHEPLVQAIQDDGWILQKYSNGEIASVVRRKSIV